MTVMEASRRPEPEPRGIAWPPAPLRLQLGAMPEGARTLCEVDYGVAAAGHAGTARVTVPLRSLLGGATAERWLSPLPLQSADEGEAGWVDNGVVLMVRLAVDATDPEAAAERAYRRLLDLLAARGYPHLLRVWNYLGRINAGEGDDERYRRFCVGRHRALAGQPNFERWLPAASAIGAGGDALHLHAFACRHPGLQVENPRQVSAFRYPRSYGLRSPSFSRATLVPWADGAQLFVSGTASIVGHATAHAGDVVAQLEQTAANLDALRTHAAASHLPGVDPASLVPELYTVYLRHDEDLPAIRGVLAGRFGDAPCQVLAGDICRRELLVEVEASYRQRGIGA